MAARYVDANRQQDAAVRQGQRVRNRHGITCVPECEQILNMLTMGDGGVQEGRDSGLQAGQGGATETAGSRMGSIEVTCERRQSVTVPRVEGDGVQE